MSTNLIVSVLKKVNGYRTVFTVILAKTEFLSTIRLFNKTGLIDDIIDHERHELSAVMSAPYWKSMKLCS